MHKKIVLLGVGSFNPPTIMHLRMLEIAKSYLEMKSIKVLEGILSPVADQFNKPSLIKSVHRLALVQQATKSSSWIRADDWECTQPQWSRTLTVLEHHQEKSEETFGKDVQVMLVVGGDVVETFTRILSDGSNLWKPEDVCRIVQDFGLIVISRENSMPEVHLEKVKQNLASRVIFLKEEVCPCDVSSTRIRSAIADGRSIKYATPDGVIDYINAHNLYFTRKD